MKGFQYCAVHSSYDCCPRVNLAASGLSWTPFYRWWLPDSGRNDYAYLHGSLRLFDWRHVYRWGNFTKIDANRNFTPKDRGIFIKVSLSDIFLVHTWTSIFAVECSFLFFLKTLSSRVDSMELLWRYITAITFLTWVGCCVGPIIRCSYFDDHSGRLSAIGLVYMSLI